MRISPEQRTQNGRSGAVTFLEQRVQIWQKPLAQLEHVAADGFVGFPKPPRLLAERRFLRVVARERLEDSELRPAGKQLAGGVSVVATDVDARPANAREPEVLQLREAHGQVFPRGRVIAGPEQGMALYAGVARP